MTTLTIITTIIAATTIIGIGASPILLQQQSYSWTNPNPTPRKAPPAITGDNVYVA